MKLIQMIKLQLYIMLRKRNFRISFSIMMLYTLGIYLINVYVNLGVDVSATMSASSLFILNNMEDHYIYLKQLFPFVVLFPYSFSYLDDKKTRMGLLLTAKMGNKYYYLSQMITCFLGGMTILFIPIILNLILTSITFIETGYTYFGFYSTWGYCSTLLGTNVIVPTINSGMSFLECYIQSPFLYSVMYTLFFSLFGGLISIFGLACSFYVRKHKITLLIITYLLFLGGRIMDNMSYSYDIDTDTYTGIYINTNFLDYVSVNTAFGKSPLLFIGFCLILFIFSIASVRRFIRLDQI